MFAFQNKLYIAKHNHLLSWDGNNWEKIFSAESFLGTSDIGILDLIEYQNKLIAAGQFMIDSSTFNIVTWDGDTLLGIGDSILNYPSNALFDIENYNNKLYLTGITWPYENIHVWDGLIWDTLPVTDYHRGIHIIGNSLFTNRGKKWDGIDWEELDFEIPCIEKIYTDGDFTVGLLLNDSLGKFIGTIDNSSHTTRFIADAYECTWGIEEYQNQIYLTTKVTGDSVKGLYMLDGTLSVPEEINSNTNFNIYPNPFNNSFVISTKGRNLPSNATQEILLFDLFGEKLDFSFLEMTDEMYEFNTSHLQKGIYILEVGRNKKKIVKK